MSVAARLNYYRRISSAYLLRGKSQLTFWHDHPQENPGAAVDKLAEYYMPFVEKAAYAGAHDGEAVDEAEPRAESLSASERPRDF